MTENSTKAIEVRPAQKTTTRNQSIECFRLISSIMVVFVHYKFPGISGSIIDCLARFAVPFFCMVSGYFAYQADEITIQKRIKSIAKLNIYATVFYLFWGSFKEKYFYNRGRFAWLLDRLSLKELSNWIILSINPFSDHLWYLTAILVCYVILYLYIRWQEKNYKYTSLYIVSLSLYFVHAAMSLYISIVGYGVAYELYRNAIFFGVPMFGLGIFIREYRERIIEVYQLSAKRLTVIIFIGAIFSLLQWFGTGEVEMPFGTLGEVIAIMLLLSSIPKVLQTSSLGSMIISTFGKLSLIIYIVHPFWIDIYDWYIVDSLSVLRKSTIEFLSPILVALLTAFAGVIWIIITAIIKKTFKKRKCKEIHMSSK